MESLKKGVGFDNKTKSAARHVGWPGLPNAGITASPVRDQRLHHAGVFFGLKSGGIADGGELDVAGGFGAGTSTS